MDRRARMLRTLGVLGIEATLTDAVDGKYEMKNIHTSYNSFYIKINLKKQPSLFQSFELVAAPGFRDWDAAQLPRPLLRQRAH